MRRDAPRQQIVTVIVRSLLILKAELLGDLVRTPEINRDANEDSDERSVYKFRHQSRKTHQLQIVHIASTRGGWGWWRGRRRPWNRVEIKEVEKIRLSSVASG